MPVCAGTVIVPDHVVATPVGGLYSVHVPDGSVTEAVAVDDGFTSTTPAVCPEPPEYNRSHAPDTTGNGSDVGEPMTISIWFPLRSISCDASTSAITVSKLPASR